MKSVVLCYRGRGLTISFARVLAQTRVGGQASNPSTKVVMTVGTGRVLWLARATGLDVHSFCATTSWRGIWAGTRNPHEPQKAQHNKRQGTAAPPQKSGKGVGVALASLSFLGLGLAFFLWVRVCPSFSSLLGGGVGLRSWGYGCPCFCFLLWVCPCFSFFLS